MYGATAATIVSTRALPYTLLGLTGAVALLEAAMPSPYSYIAMYITFVAVGAYHLSKIHVKNTLTVLPAEEDAAAEEDADTDAEEEGVDAAEEDAAEEDADADAEEDIYADMPPLIPIPTEEHTETPVPVVPVSPVVPSMEDTAAPLPPSPLSSPDSDDEEMYANMPALEEVTFEDTSIPELYVPLYEIHNVEAN